MSRQGRRGAERDHAQQEATTAQARFLAAQAIARSRTKPELSLLLAKEARRLQDSAETRGALLTAVQGVSHLERLVSGLATGEVIGGMNRDGSVLAISDAHRVRLVDLGTRRERWSLPTGDTSNVVVAFSPDERLVATGAANHVVRVWDHVPRRTLTSPLRGHDYPVWQAEFGPDGRELATQDSNGTVIVWDVASGHERARVDVSVNFIYPSDLSFSPDGRYLAIGSTPAIVLDAATGQHVLEIPSPDGTFNPLAFNPSDGLLAVAVRGSNTVDLWNVDNGTTVRTVGQPQEFGSTNPIWRIGFSSDGSRLASSFLDGSVVVRDAVSGKAIEEPLPGYGEPATWLRFSGDGAQLRTGSRAAVAAWNIEGEEALVTGIQVVPESIGLNDVAVNPQNTVVATGDAKGNRLRELDARTLEPIRDAAVFADTGSGTGVTGLSFTRDGTAILAGDGTGNVNLVEARNLEPRNRPLHISSSPVLGVDVSRDGRWAGAGALDGSVTLIDLKHWNVRWHTEVHGTNGLVLGVAFSPDGKLLASGGSDGRLVLQRTRDGKQRTISRGVGGQMSAAYFSPDSRHVAAAFADRSVQIVDVATGRALTILPAVGNSVVGMPFSPDGRYLALATADGIILIDTTTGQQIGTTIAGGTSQSIGLAYSPDARHLFAANTTEP